MKPLLILDDILARHQREQPHALAIRAIESGARRNLTYQGLAQRTAQAAARLWHAWGVRAGDRVAYLGLNQADQIVLLFALARLGAILVPLNYRLAPPEWSAVLADCTPRCLLYDAAWSGAGAALARQHGLAAHALATLAGPGVLPVAPRRADPAAPALLVYTSGTTGQPRGALHTQANLIANMAAALAVQEITQSDLIATVLPLFHVGGLCIQTLPALCAGAAVLLHERFDAGALLASLAQDRPTLTLQVPATMKALIEHPGWAGADLSCLRAVWAGSSTLPDALVAAFHARGVPVCNVYGATETGPFSIALAPEHALSHAGSCGWPAPGVEVRLARSQPGAEVGELLLRAPNVVERYWPDQPARDGEGWFHSGDLARQAPDGSYTIVGRAKDLIISGGENIYPAEIENLLAGHPLVAECAVLGQPDAQWGEIVVAVVVLRPQAAGADALADWEPTLREFLRTRIARYKQPRRWQALPALPKTALGKVQKQQLAQILTHEQRAA
ncbi:MAG: long-chain fatty acid--CoA ligase [Burkholderiaceae bacterium]|nr:MAG: long-chain fatty acid--CoA ligase [Burkholderiaceae bacterium]